MALDTVAGLISRVAYNLGRGAHATVVALIPEWINLAQRELCRQGKWWFNFAEDTSNTLVQSADTLSYPVDFLDEEYFFLKDADGDIYELSPMENMEYRREYTDKTGSAHESRPRHYMMRKDDVLVRPISDDTYTGIIGYWKQLADLVSGGASNDLLDTYPDILEAGATYKGFQYMQEYNDAKYWLERYNEESTKLRIANAEREFPSEMILSVRPGGKSTRIGGRTSRLGMRNYYPRGGY